MSTLKHYNKKIDGKRLTTSNENEIKNWINSLNIQEEDIMSKILVSYFSASGVTKRKALEFSKEVGGDLFEIRLKEIYTEDDLNTF